MKHLPHLFESNRKWVAEMETQTPGFFEELARVHNPTYLWIGCSDSRVPANEIIGVKPGELFVHRNIANQVIHTDFNSLAVIQYAVDILKVKHIIVCGHYGCGGIQAALETKYHGLIDNWLRNLQEIIRIKRKQIFTSKRRSEQLRRLSEWNVIRQTLNVGDTTIVQDAWRRHQDLVVHGWVFDLADGLLRDLNLQVSSLSQLQRLETQFFEAGDACGFPVSS